jgi:hypothetical protein
LTLNQPLTRLTYLSIEPPGSAALHDFFRLCGAVGPLRRAVFSD